MTDEEVRIAHPSSRYFCGRYSGFGCGFAALGDTLEISSWKTTVQSFAVK
jgi:tetrahydromethanopterin S-methyltransferase subunit E